MHSLLILYRVFTFLRYQDYSFFNNHAINKYYAQSYCFSKYFQNIVLIWGENKQLETKQVKIYINMCELYKIVVFYLAHKKGNLII